jgi:hypothetical protein
MPSINPRQRSALWWVYFACLVLLFGISFMNYVRDGFFASFASMLISCWILSFDLICLAGLYAYIRSTALFVRRFWKVVVVVLVARVSLLTSLFIYNLFPWDRTTEHYVALFALLSLLFSLPLLFALWRYAFNAPQVWTSHSSATAPDPVS